MPMHKLAFTVPSGGQDTRRSLVLSGGGMRLSYQAGVLRALEKEGLTFQHIDGTSGGSLNLSMLLCGLTPTEMCGRWESLDLARSVSLMPLKEYIQAAPVALGSADGFVDYVYPHLGIDIGRLRAARGVEGTFNVFNYGRKVNEVVPHTDMTLDLLVAGMSLPGVMPPVSTNGGIYLDSAFSRDANLMEAVRRGAEEIWLVWCLGNTDVYRGGLLNIYVQMLEMAANASLNREFDQIDELNARIEAGDSPYGQKNAIRLHVIRPPTPLPLDPDLYLGKVSASTLIARGYADAMAYLDVSEPNGLPLTPETIMMTAAQPGITFSETMEGPFALDAEEPRIGRLDGERSGTSLAMHVTVEVRDLNRFVTDPNHSGTLVGTIDFAPFGRAMPTGEGIFRLFSPAENPGVKLMVYEVPFKHEGVDYYLAGRKEVHDDPGFDLWSDTTTLYTRLHRGSDTSGAVVGAGMLSLDAQAFMKVLTSIRALDAGSPTEGLALIARFGEFFAGELWKSYARAGKR